MTKPAARPAKRDDREILRVGGREVAISNPHKVLFPDAGHTKLDLVRYYLAVADGALRGAGGRPNVLVRYPNGIAGDFFYQKRAPASRPEWIEVITLEFPSGLTAEEVVLAKALRGLAASTGHWAGRIGAIAQALVSGTAEPDLEPYLARMSLQSPTTVGERLQRRLLVTALRAVTGRSRPMATFPPAGASKGRHPSTQDVP